MNKTSLGDLEPGSPVNLEPALTLNDALGGHLVQGHVDAVADVVGVSEAGGEYRLQVTPPAAQQPYIVERGSVTLNGVSLTVVGVREDGFDVALIPHTLAVTILGERRPGDPVNLEADVLGKYVKKYLERVVGPGA